jgi:GAF domain-containing protein/anti-sigma regulatory factor (Ser/Thr protein kinase)
MTNLDRDRLVRLQAVTAALSEAATPAQVVEAVVEQGIAALGARAGLVALLTDDGVELELVQSRGYAERVMVQWRRFPLDARLPLSDVVRDAAPLFIETQGEWAVRYPEMAQQAPAIAAAAAMPLIADGKPFGGMYFSFAGERRFTEEDGAFLASLARQCGLALERSRLYEESERRRARAEAAERRLGFLARASAILGASLDYQGTLASLARLAVPDLADWSAVDVVSEDGKSLERLAIVHINPDKIEWAREVQRRFPPDMESPRGVPGVIRSGVPAFVPEVTDAMLAAGISDPALLAALRQMGLASIIIAPLAARGRSLGAVTLVTTSESGRRYTPEDLVFAEELARRAGLAVDNARLYSEAQREILERQQAEAARDAVLAQRRRFVRDMVFSLTEGRLRLCDTEADLPAPLPYASESIALTPPTIRLLRKRLEAVAEGLRFPKERVQDIETAVGEAAMNAVRHAGGGVGRVHADRESGVIQVWIVDKGAGISQESIHRAALEKGFSTGGSLGHGFFLMRSVADRVYLLTGLGGTTVVLEQEHTAPEPSWMQGSRLSFDAGAG